MRAPRRDRATAARIEGRALWQRARTTDLPADETARFLDLAGYADGRLDADDRERIAGLLAGDPDMAADVAAARALAGLVEGPRPRLDAIVERAIGLLAPPRRRRLPAFPARARRLYDVAQWGALAAALALAAWLGFAMGSDASLGYGESVQSAEDALMPELLDPATGFLRDLGAGITT